MKDRQSQAIARLLQSGDQKLKADYLGLKVRHDQAQRNSRRVPPNSRRAKKWFSDMRRIQRRIDKVLHNQKGK